MRTYDIATHASEIDGAPDELVRYLEERKHDVRYARHPFAYTGNDTSRLRHSRSGVLIQERSLRIAGLVSLLRDVIANLLWFSTGRRSDVFVGVNCVNGFCGIVLRALRRTRRVVYYVIDWTPRRFRSRLLSALYVAACAFVARRADEVWSVSSRICEVHRHQGVPEQKNRLVPIGIDTLLANRVAVRNDYQIVIASHLTVSKGVQLAIAAMPIICKRMPAARLVIAGTGPYESALRQLARDLKVDDVVQFLGHRTKEDVYELLLSSGIAIATYLDDEASITQYADPTKPKEYLACGLPVVITDVPWIAEPIRELPMGRAVGCTSDEIADACIDLLSNTSLRQMCAVNGRRFVAGLSWHHIFDAAVAR